METKNREKMLLILVGVCVALYVVNAVIITPLTNSWKARQVRISELEREIRDGHTTLESAKSIEDKWNHMRTNTLSINPSVNEDQLFKAFQNWSTSTRVVLISQKPAPKPNSEDPLMPKRNGMPT